MAIRATVLFTLLLSGPVHAESANPADVGRA